MAQGVARAIERPGHLVVEAGTGVGKSFAYLVPAIQAAIENKKKVVVSTHTIALQEQLLKKDIPFLRAVTGLEFSAVLVKGRSNYISLRRLDVALQRQDSMFQRPEDIRPARHHPALVETNRRRQSLGPGFSTEPQRLGGRAERERQLPGTAVPEIQGVLLLPGQAQGVQRRPAGGQSCPVRQRPGPEGRRALGSCPSTPWRSSTRRIRSRRSLASTWACSFPASASISRWRGCTTSGRKRGFWVFTTSRRRSNSSRTRIAADDFFDRVAEWHQQHHAGFNGRVREPIDWPESVCEELRKLSTAIGQGAKPIERPEHHVELVAAEERCRALADQISTWIRQGTSDSVYWVEVENKARPRVRLAAAPLDVGPSLRKLLFNKVPTCVLTSATLCVGSPPKFDFIKARLGLTSAETIALGSPFDYARQVTVHMPKNLPDPSDEPESFEKGAIRAIAHYLERTQGKAFVLFTSYKMLEAAAPH